MSVSSEILGWVTLLLGHLFDPLANRVSALKNLKKNAAKLSGETESLGSMKADKERTATAMEARQHQMERSHLFIQWIKDVESLVKSSDEFAVSFRNRPSIWNLSCCCSSTSCGCWSKYQLGKMATELLEKASELKSQGESFAENNFFIPAEVPLVEGTPVYSAGVGREKERSQIIHLLEDDDVGIIGVHGMGGIGKTSLLEELNNDSILVRSLGFDIVIWATVSQNMNVIKIQIDIGERLNFHLSPNEGSVKSNAKILLRSLKRKNFLLVLDDLWEEVDLREIGIPPLNAKGNGVMKKSKMILTSRSRDVCATMGVKERGMVEVGLLSPEESWQLFRAQVVNEELLQRPPIEPLARAVADECGRLPLALIAVGRSMSSATEEFEWRNAKRMLEESAHRFRGMDKVLQNLKFSYDKLRSNALRTCLLYCSQFPEDYEVPEDELVGLLVGEGILGTEDQDICSDRDEVRTLICDLESAALLKRSYDAIDCGKHYVSMHDCVRDMALWLTDGKYDESNLFLRWSHTRSRSRKDFFSRWEHATRICLGYSFGSFNELSDDGNEIRHCRGLVTFLAGNTRIGHISDNFFRFMPALRVLDLSHSHIKEFPASVGLLTGLRYLNLTFTDIRRLPKELGGVEQLQQLFLNSTWHLSDIPYEAISRLHNLQMLDMLDSGYKHIWRWSSDNRTSQNTERQLALQDLESLDKLCDIQLEMTDEDAFDELMNSGILRKSVSSLHLNGINPSSNYIQSDAFKSMARLRTLLISETENLVFCEDKFRRSSIQSFQNLSTLSLQKCAGTRNTTWAFHLPCLKYLRVVECNDMEQLIAGHEMVVLEEGSATRNQRDCGFQNLIVLILIDCSSLWSISGHNLRFPSLEFLHVIRCPSLKKLPFGSDSKEKIKIDGSQEWWDSLQWDDDNIRSKYLPYFLPQADE